MRAVLSRTVGGPETLTLETVYDPVPGAGEVVIRVEACGVNFPDALLIADKYQIIAPRPFSPGLEVCGYITSKSSDVHDLSVGQRVIARARWGGMAEKLSVAAS